MNYVKITNENTSVYFDSEKGYIGRYTYSETYPAVNAVILQKSDGKKILLAYNFSDKEQTVELNDVCYKVLPKSFADFELY